MSQTAKDVTTYGKQDIELLERWWVEKARKNFFAYRQFIRCANFKHNWFIAAFSKELQQFYYDYTQGRRPILVISVPPQHGKSWAIEDLVSWIAGQNPDLRQVYASFSEYLGKRCNSGAQRTITSPKYRKIFPDTNINAKNVVTLADTYKKNSTLVEFINHEGSFRNTTVGGPITGETLDIGYIDDPFKGRLESNSETIRNGVWDWFTDDFGTRFSDDAGYVITTTRWHVDDIVGRLLQKYSTNPNRITYFKYPAIAEQDEMFRKAGEPLFPELKSLEFLLDKKEIMLEPAWQSLYQSNPTLAQGNLIKIEWFQWWSDLLPPLEYTFAVADTAQKKSNRNDFTVMQYWGRGLNGNIYMVDMKRERMEAPELRRNAEIFYRKCQAHSTALGVLFKGICIEDKSSGIGLIQELRVLKFLVFEIPREKDKITRAYDAGPEIKMGKVFLNSEIPDVGVVLDEAKEFPSGTFDDAFDCTMNAVEVSYIYPEILNYTIFIS